MRGMRSGIYTWEQSFPKVLLVCVLPVFSLPLDPPSLRVDVCDPASLEYRDTHSFPGCLRHQLQLGASKGCSGTRHWSRSTQCSASAGLAFGCLEATAAA